MSIQHLLNEARRVSDETPEPAPSAPRPSSRIADLIEIERNKPLETVPFDMAFGETVAEVIIIQLRGHRWEDLPDSGPRSDHPDDMQMNYNTAELLESWPTDSVTVAGDHPTPEQWKELVALIDAPARRDIVSALWWLHWGKPIETLKRLQIEQAQNQKGAQDA